MANKDGMIFGSATAVVGAIIAIAFSWTGVGGTIGIGLMVSGALSTAGAALAPRPSDGSGGMGGTTYGTQAASVAAEGEPKKIILGKMRVYPEIISIRTVSDGKTETVRVLCHVGSGGQYGIESISDVELNDNSLDHYGDAVEYDYRLGTSDQDVMTGFDETSIAYTVNEQLPNTAWTYQTKGAVDAVGIALTWYGGLAKIGSQGIEQAFWAAEVEYQDANSIQWIKVLPGTGVQDGWSNTLTIGGHSGKGWVCYGNSTSAVRRLMRIEFPSKKVRKIRINTFLSYSDESYRRQATVTRVEEIVDDQDTDSVSAYAGEALLGIKYVANEQLGGGLPKISCVVKGWKVQNLGDTSPAWTQNPAKLLLAVLTDEKDGCGRYFPTSLFDDGVGGSWRTRESYFDDQVIIKESKGRNRLEDRMHLDLVIDSMQNAEEWVQHILDLTRSHMIDWGEDGIRLVGDVASSSVATFDGRQARDPANRPILALGDGRIDLLEHEVETDKRTTHLTGIYWDESDNYARRYTDELVDPDYVDGDPRVTAELFMPGVTRQSQALRQCRYRLNVDRLRPLVYDMGVGIGDLNLLPMDVITVYSDSPPLSAVKMLVLGTSYDKDPTRGRISAVIYDADVYDDTTETLQPKAPSLSRAVALKKANTTPAGVTNVKLSEVVGSSHLRAQWDVSADANRRYLRVYRSKSAQDKGWLEAEIEPTATSYLIRNVYEVLWYIRVLSVGRGGTEEEWTTSGGSASILITRQKNKPGALGNVAAQNVGQAVAKAVAVNPPAADDVAQTIEVIKGPDEYTGQLVGSYTQEKTGTTGEQGQRTTSVPLTSQPGRRTGGGNESIVVRAITDGGKAPGASTTVSVPFLDMPNHSPTLLASIEGSTLVGFDAAGSTDAWEFDATDGARLRAIPTQANATSANGWGTGASGLIADNPAGAKYVVEGTITSQELDLGATKTFSIECYDEAQRSTAQASVAAKYARWPAMPGALQNLEGYEDGPMWAARLLDGNLRPLRPLSPTYWEYEVGTSSPLSGTWSPLVPGAMVRGRYVRVRFTLRDLLGLHQVICPRVYVRAWIAHDSRILTSDGMDFGAGELAPIGAGQVNEIGVRVDTGNESIQVNIGGTIMKVSVSA